MGGQATYGAATNTTTGGGTTGGTSSTGNNSDEVVTIITMTSSFILGLKDASIEAIKGFCQLITHPWEIAIGIDFLAKAVISGTEETRLGWDAKAGNLSKVVPGKSIGGDIFSNRENLLPNSPARIWYEADINYTSGYRGSDRLLYSNDGLIYKSTDHYKTFTKIK